MKNAKVFNCLSRCQRWNVWKSKSKQGFLSPWWQDNPSALAGCLCVRNMNNSQALTRSQASQLTEHSTHSAISPCLTHPDHSETLREHLKGFCCAEELESRAVILNVGRKKKGTWQTDSKLQEARHKCLWSCVMTQQEKKKRKIAADRKDFSERNDSYQKKI